MRYRDLDGEIVEVAVAACPECGERDYDVQWIEISLDNITTRIPGFITCRRHEPIR
jgi:hypothetical protein